MRLHKRHPPAGADSGALVIPKNAPPPRLRIVAYHDERLEDVAIADVEELVPHRSSGKTIWLDVQGLGDERVLRRLGEIFSLHPLVLADICNVPQRPKFEDYDKFDFLVARTIQFKHPLHVTPEQLSIVIGDGFVLTFEERTSGVLEPVRARMQRAAAAHHKVGADSIAYAVLDAVIDCYYPVLEDVGELIEDLEDEIIADPSMETMRRVNETKRVLLLLRRAMWPQRDALSALLRGESKFFGEAERIYLRDCYDHASQLLDTIETYRELVTGLMDAYLSSVSNRMNEIMKVLTIMATIFIPLSFLAGVYGMNFEYMPELHSSWGYPVFWVVIIILAAAMVYYFWRRGWLGDGTARAQAAERRTTRRKKKG